jgi:hypothetical protein
MPFSAQIRSNTVSGIDDSSRFGVSAKLVRRATAGPVCEALLAALRRLADAAAEYPIPEVGGQPCGRDDRSPNP